jgi:hypothetical protein
VELLPQGLERRRTRFRLDDRVPSAGGPQRDRLLAAPVEARGKRGDRLGVAMVLEQLVPLEAEIADHVGSDQRLPRVVEDPEHVVGVDKERLEELEPARLEVLALVHHDRVVAGLRLCLDGGREGGRQRVVPPVLRDRRWARWQHTR